MTVVSTSPVPPHPFDAAEHLDTAQRRHAYAADAIAEGDPAEIEVARDVLARAGERHDVSDEDLARVLEGLDQAAGVLRGEPVEGAVVHHPALGFTFNDLLRQAGVAPSDVRLLRHVRTDSGRQPFEMWRDDRQAFDLFQSGQDPANRSRLASPHWASFVALPSGEVQFAGLYNVSRRRLTTEPFVWPHVDKVSPPGTIDLYDMLRDERFSPLEGCLEIEWGPGARGWIQRADKQNKRVVELRRRFVEPKFPGYSALVTDLSKITSLPPTWAAILKEARGVYLLTCPRTREQYVGSATGGDGFLGRWLSYAADGHGGNIGLKSRSPSDYTVSILEVAGSLATHDDVLMMEQRWKAKLQSREMGLNRN